MGSQPVRYRRARCIQGRSTRRFAGPQMQGPVDERPGLGPG